MGVDSAAWPGQRSAITPAEARALATELAAGAVANDERLWAAGARELARLDGRGWLALDQAARSYRHPAMPVSGVRGWLGHSLGEPTGFVAALTSLHVDGRFREHAVVVLASIDGEIATRALAVRLLDHVPQVRAHAAAALRTRVDPRSIELVLDTVLAGRNRLQAAEAIAGLRQLIATLEEAGTARPLDVLMTSGLRRVRRWAFALAHERGRLDDQDLVRAAVGDADQWVQAMCARWLMQTAAPSALVPLLEARSVEARLVAVTRVPGSAVDQDVLVRLLSDRAPRVREQARWRARKLGVDVVETYRHLARTSERPRERATALDALALVGDESDVPIIVAALADRHVRVRAAAVTAVLGRLERPRATVLLTPLLDDVSGRVSSAAARALMRLGVAGSVAATAWQSERPSSRRAAWRVARSTGGWHRVEADLRAAADHDRHLASLGEAGIRNWLEVGAATTWSVLTDDQRARIATHLDASRLDPERKRVVSFHAAIPALGHGTD